MKKILMFILIIILNSCSYINQDKIEVEIINKSESAVENLNFRTLSDQVQIEKLERNEKMNKTLDFDNSDTENPNDGWSISFSRFNGKIVELSCTDILIDKKKRKLQIIIFNDEIETEYNGECF